MKRPRAYRIIEKIETGGSDRAFYRLARSGRTYILLQGKHMTEYLSIRRYLERKGTPVPRLYASYRDRAIVEDLGGRTLLQATVERSGIDPAMYRRVVEELVKMQVGRPDAIPVRLRYDIGHIRWEQGYFREFYLGQYSGIKAAELKRLDRDFEILARDVVFWNRPFDGYFMHRDFQSQNIIIHDDQPWFIDFQSARIGPLTYDLASLLRDSYLTIGEKSEDSMLYYYLDQLKHYGLFIDKLTFLKAYRLAGLQRNMQALGAFANLTVNKGKPFFRRHIPRAVRLLRSGLRDSPYRELTRIVDQYAKI